MIEYISIMAIPLMLFVIVITGIIEKKDILSLFVRGAVDGLKVMYKIFPHILAIMVGVALFRETGAMEIVFKPINGILNSLNIPEDIVTLSILRPVSGGAAQSVVMDIFQNYGPDSIEGKIASIIMGGTETTFYVITILYGAVGIKKIRGTLAAALIADFAAIALSIFIVLKGFI